MIPTELKQKLYANKNRIGLVGGSIKIQEYDSAEQNISAGISPTGWNIEISVKKDFEPIKDRRQKAYARKKKITDGLETMLTDISLHEFAHWELPFNSEKGCPYDSYNHDKIVEAIKNALPNNKKNQASYVANAFEDLIINPRCKEWNKNFSGQVLFWDWEGIQCKEKGQKNYTPFYEAFVKLNMHLLGDNLDKALLKRHYTNDKNVDAAVKKAIKELNLSENIKDTSIFFKNNLIPENMSGTQIRFFYEWPNMAKIFAKNLAELLEIAPTERLSAFSQKGGGDGQQNKQPAGNGIEQKIATKEGKEEIAYARYSSGDKQSPNFTSHEQLDSLYKRLARAIPVKIEAMTKEQSMEICPLNYRKFDEEKDSPQKMKLSKLYLNEGEIQFGHPNQPLTIPYRAKMQAKSFPDFKLVVLDNSGTMKDGIDGNSGNKNFIPWGDNSKYHFALRGLYGIENFLQQQGIAQYINHGIAAYSSTTRYKEARFKDLEEIKKLALSPEFGNTILDAEVLVDALQGKEGFVLSISDGEIHNWNTEKENMEKLLEQNTIYFAHIQIGNETEYTKDLESWNLPVFYVNSGQDLTKLMINITKETYKRFTKK